MTTDLPEKTDAITPISLEQEMKRSYLDYAMSVIVSRALPDVRDGLKPVHRRVLYSMHENGFEWNKAYRKSARVVGDVIGKYHPHGDQAIYESLVRMTQDFSMSLPLLDGQGNFGSLDGDAAAAMRYTEVRMDRSAHFLLADIEKDTIEFQKNYDNSELEPTVLPAGFPNIIVNGGTGIAVGMATNIPPHNLGEVLDGCLALLDDPNLSIEDLCTIIPGPDFPTGALIIGRSGIASCYRTGRGSIIMRALAEVEELKKDKKAIVITQIPYGVNKAHIIEKIAELVRDKRIEGITDLRDESDRSGIRMVVELKREAAAEVILNQLYKFSQLQTNFAANMLTLNNGRPELMDLRAILKAFLAFREQVIVRRTKFELAKARDKAHILVALSIAVANIDKVVGIIRAAANTEAARTALMSERWLAADMRTLLDLIADPRGYLNEDNTYAFLQEQAQAILDLRLQRLTALGRDDIHADLMTLADKIAEYLNLLADRGALLDVMRGEFTQAREQLAQPRRTQILDIDDELEDDALIPLEDVVVTISHGGYVKRVPASNYKAQRRGGKGRSGMTTKEDDFVGHLFLTTTHTDILFFSSKGIVYKLKTWRLPSGSLQSKGKAFVNLLPLQAGERITSVLPLPMDAEQVDLVFATRKGYVRRNRLDDFKSINRSGKIAMKFEENDDEIIGVVLVHMDEDIFLTTNQGRCIRFPLDRLRVFSGRTSTGVLGLRLNLGDHIISLVTLKHIDAQPEEVRAYLKQAKMLQRQQNPNDGESEEEARDEDGDADGDEREEDNAIITLTPERFEELAAKEQFVLTVSEKGFGKRTSSYEYRATNRGGKGIAAMTLNVRGGAMVAAMPVEVDDEVIFATDGGTILRCLVHEIRLIGRTTQGVIVLRTGAQEKIVSVDRIALDKEDEGVDSPA